MDIEAALRSTGDALAHAVGSVRLGGTLCTFAMVHHGSTHELIRYEAESIQVSVDGAHVQLAKRLGDDSHAVLVYDGFVTTDQLGRTDAFLVEILGSGGAVHGTVVQPYRPAKRFGLPIIGRVCTPLGDPQVENSIAHDNPLPLIYEGIRGAMLGKRFYGLRD